MTDRTHIKVGKYAEEEYEDVLFSAQHVMSIRLQLSYTECMYSYYWNLS